MFNRFIDINCIYIKKCKIDNNDDKSNFIKNENMLMLQLKPCIKFYSAGKLKYYHNLNSFENFGKPSIGYFRIYNNTIEACREYYSPQSGYYFGTSIFIIKDSIIEERSFPIKNGITTIYEKRCK